MRSALLRVNTILASFASIVEPYSHILDIGAGKGHLAQQMQHMLGARVTMADVAQYNQTDLALTVCDSRALAFRDRTFDYAILSFVLHHSPNPDVILCDALRVARQVIVVENDVRGQIRGALTQAVDCWPTLRYGTPPCHATWSREMWLKLFRRFPVETRILAEFTLDFGFYRCFTVHLHHLT